MGFSFAIRFSRTLWAFPLPYVSPDSTYGSPEPYGLFVAMRAFLTLHTVPPDYVRYKRLYECVEVLLFVHCVHCVFEDGLLLFYWVSQIAFLVISHWVQSLLGLRSQLSLTSPVLVFAVSLCLLYGRLTTLVCTLSWLKRIVEFKLFSRLWVHVASSS